MNTHRPNPRNVNATTWAVALIVLVTISGLIWFREAGYQWANILYALIPLAGAIYWMSIPAEQRAKAQGGAQKELNKSSLGRFWKKFTWGLYLLAALLLIKTLFDWIYR